MVTVSMMVTGVMDIKSALMEVMRMDVHMVSSIYNCIPVLIHNQELRVIFNVYTSNIVGVESNVLSHPPQ